MTLVPSSGRALRWPAPAGDVYAAWVNDLARAIRIDRATYESARADVAKFWQESLARAPTIEVPEQRVSDAEKALLVQELAMTWRYSVGNTYEELSFAEALDVSQVMAAYGYGDVARQILRYTLRMLPARYTNWRLGERLVAGATYYRLDRDRRYVAEETPGLAAAVARLERELAASPTGLLPRERYSSDIPTQIYSLQGQTLVWQGLLGMSRAWAQTGHVELAARSRRLALRLEAGLRRAVRASSRRLPDGSLFVPAGLLDRGRPFDRITDSRDGTYWNLVIPYALASGFFAPHSAEARGLSRYLDLHGSRLLGVVRAGAYRLSPSGSDPASGIDQVYGVNVSRFLADEDDPDQLVLGLYGTLAAAMASGTYVTGESASIAPLGADPGRSMYLPPNSGGNATLLETLRVMLVHETRRRDGAPSGLELGFAAPRPWLADGKQIVVTGAPTSFGPVGYSIRRDGATVHVTVDPPPSRPDTLRIRLRLPGGARLAAVELAGRPVPFDPVTGTIELTGRVHHLELDALVGGPSGYGVREAGRLG